MICLAFAFAGFGSRHFPAFFCALVTDFSASLAMLHFMFGAFITARLANLSAERAELCGKRIATCHPARCQRADVRAGAVERDAARHHFYVVLAQTG